MKNPKISWFFDGFLPGILWSFAAWCYFLNILLLEDVFFALTVGVLLVLGGCLLSRPLLALTSLQQRSGFTPVGNILCWALAFALWGIPLQRSNPVAYIIVPLLLAGALQTYLLSMAPGGDNRQRNRVATVFGGAACIAGLIVSLSAFRVVCGLQAGYEAIAAETLTEGLEAGTKWWIIGTGGLILLLISVDISRQFGRIIVQALIVFGCFVVLAAGIKHLIVHERRGEFSVLPIAAIEIPFCDTDEQWRVNDRPGKPGYAEAEEIAGSALPIALMMGDGEYKVLFVGTPFDSWPLPLARWESVRGIDWLVDPVYWRNQPEETSSRVRFLPSQPLFLTGMMMEKSYRLIVLWDHPAAYPALLRQLKLVDRLAPGGVLVMPEVTAKAVNAAERFKDRLPFETSVPGPDRLVAFSDRPLENDPVRLAERLSEWHPLKDSFEILYSLPAAGENAGPVRFRDGQIAPAEVQSADYVYAPWGIGAVALLFLSGIFLGRKGKRHRLLLGFHCGGTIGIILFLLLMAGYQCGFGPQLWLPVLFCSMVPVLLRNSHSGLLTRAVIVAGVILTVWIGPEFVVVVATATALHNGAVCRFLEIETEVKWNEELFFFSIVGAIIGFFVAERLVDAGCGILLLLTIYGMIELPLLAVRKN